MLLSIASLGARLRRLELTAADRDCIQPALLAHVCSRVQLEGLDVSGWKSWTR